MLTDSVLYSLVYNREQVFITDLLSGKGVEFPDDSWSRVVLKKAKEIWDKKFQEIASTDIPIRLKAF